ALDDRPVTFERIIQRRLLFLLRLLAVELCRHVTVRQRAHDLLAVELVELHLLDNPADLLALDRHRVGEAPLHLLDPRLEGVGFLGRGQSHKGEQKQQRKSAALEHESLPVLSERLTAAGPGTRRSRAGSPRPTRGWAAPAARGT